MILVLFNMLANACITSSLIKHDHFRYGLQITQFLFLEAIAKNIVWTIIIWNKWNFFEKWSMEKTS